MSKKIKIVTYEDVLKSDVSSFQWEDLLHQVSKPKKKIVHKVKLQTSNNHEYGTKQN